MKNIIHTLLLMMAIANVAIGQVDNGVDKASSDKYVVGAIGGTVDVTALGGASYTIPIRLPDGINGMQPTLAVTYNSQSGNGLLGWGWNIAGVSAITRVGQTLYHDGRMGGVNFVDDRFALDGQRLLVVNGQPYGGNGTEYRTEVDGMAKIVSYTCDTTNGPACFKVWLPNGNIAYYGYKANTRIGLQQRNDVCMWMLDSIVDRDGNYVAYRYQKGYSACNLKRVLYTGNAQAHIEPAFMVEFEYTNRFDNEMAFIGNNVLRQERKLLGIKVYNNNSTKWILWKYDFEYDETVGYGSILSYNRLRRINFSCDGKKFYPTVINWGASSQESCSTLIKIDGNWANQSSGLSFVKFTGDFNGDGYTDVISSGNINDSGKFHLYLNEGKPDANRVSFTDEASFARNPNLDWIYVGDFNGDGLDDFMCVIRDRSGLFFDFVTLKPYLTRKRNDGTYWFEECESPNNGDYWLGKRKELTLVMGDFLGNRRMSFIFQTHKESKMKHKYIYFDGNDPNGHTFAQKDIPDLNAACMRAADFDGDGITELWYYTADNSDWCGHVVKLTRDYRFSAVNETVLSRKDKVFCGDFNGDGKADFLSYYENDGKWKIYLWKQNEFHWQSFDITNIMPIGDPGDHGFSILGFDGQYQAVEVADFNGDGKSDIAAVKRDGTANDRLVVLYAPFRNNGCACVQEFNRIECTDINVMAQKDICVGNFLGKENVSMFSSHLLFSLQPVAHRYSASDITDGMGNRAAFSYKYLMPNTKNPTEKDFYRITRNQKCINNGKCFVISLPMRGVERMAEYNINVSSYQDCATYQYRDAIAHNMGRGFLGFETILAIQGTSSGSSLRPLNLTKKHFGLGPMGSHYSMVVDYDSCFAVNSGNQQERVLSKVNHYVYEKKTNNNNDLVFIPLLTTQKSDVFDVYDNGRFLDRTIVKNDYGTGGRNAEQWYYYTNTIHCVKTINGVGLGQFQNNVDNAQFSTITETEYMPENYSQWVVNRPCSTKTTAYRRNDTYHPSSIVTYDYGSANPYKISRQATYPGGNVNPNDSFATYVDYVYDAVGNIDRATSGDLLGNLPAAFTDYDYYPNCRQLKRQTNQAGYETSYTYEMYYGGLETTTDCNGLVTRFSSDPLGNNSQTIHPDGTITNTSTEWVSDLDEMKPEYAKYYTSTYTTGKPHSNTYYDATGRELRSVTYGFDGRPICVDTKYNAFGQVMSVTEPFYLSNMGSEKRTVYEYDGFLRNNKTIAPDETSVETAILGFTTTTTHHPKPGSDLPDQQTSATVNAAGWTTESVDANGTAVHYAYYPDGKLKWAQIGEDETTRISLEYDNAGNRTLLADPNYGTVTSVYNAYGQLCLNTDPKGNTTEYHYDNLGRNVERIETNAETNEADTTNWHYDWNGKDQLDAIDGEHQHIEYGYDQLGRLLNVKETRDAYSSDMTTSYEYDNLSRVRGVTYPTGYSIRKEYNDLGYLARIKSEEGLPLWETIEVNEFGQIMKYKLGEDIVNAREYDASHRLGATVSERNGEIIQSFSYGYDDFSNLARRKDEKRGMEESFLYDDLNRLTTITMNGVVSSMEYDSYGRILSKQANGQTVFDGAQYNTYGDNGVLKPHAISAATMENPLAEQSITYTMFDKVKQIRRGADARVTFQYGYDHQRIESEATTRLGTERKSYFDHCEVVEEFSMPPIQRTFLGGPLGVFAVVEESDGEENLHYVLKDHLGSWTTITDAHGIIEQAQSFDAWGNMRDPDTWQNPSGPELVEVPMFDRGYTSHEHIPHMGYINMNGRVYDPVMSSFLSVDSYVQQPDNSQNFNRYAYCLNNPLKYTDPSGELIFEAVMSGVIMGLMSSSYTVVANDITRPIDVAQTLAIGAASGVLGGLAGCGAGTLAGGLMTSSGIYNPILVQGVCGAASGFAGGFAGTSSSCWMQGASFGDGLLAGLKSGGIGCLIGGGMGALQGGIQYGQGKYIFRRGCARLGIDPSDPIPSELQNDAFLKDAQKEWLSDAPMDRVKEFTVENVPENAMKSMNKNNAPALTRALRDGNKILTGNSKVYFNKDLCFRSAKDLYYTMAHEFVHVSQYEALKGLHSSILDFVSPSGENWNYIMDYYAYSYEMSLGNTESLQYMTSFSKDITKEFFQLFPDIIPKLNYSNYTWTQNTKFVYPF